MSSSVCAWAARCSANSTPAGLFSAVAASFSLFGNGRFLVGESAPDAVFTREDLSEEQQMFGRAAEEFMRAEVLPRSGDLYNHDWVLTRQLIRKAADLDFTRLEIPEAYGGLGLDKVSTACVGEQLSRSSTSATPSSAPATCRAWPTAS